MDEEQRKKLQDQLDARSRAMMMLGAQGEVEKNMPMIEGMAGMSGGLSQVGRPIAKGAIRGLVDMMEPKVNESGIISPLAEKFSGLRRYLQELGGTGAESPASVESQKFMKAQHAADEANMARELQETTMKNKPSAADTANSRYKVDQEVEKLTKSKKPKNEDKTFDLNENRRK